MTRATAPTEELLQLVTTKLSIELQDSRAEAASASSEELRSWFDGRAQGLEIAARVLDEVLCYQRRA